jgi:hypothetical protein
MFFRSPSPRNYFRTGRRHAAPKLIRPVSETPESGCGSAVVSVKAADAVGRGRSSLAVIGATFEMKMGLVITFSFYWSVKID